MMSTDIFQVMPQVISATPWLQDFAFRFGPWEYVAFIVFILVLVCTLIRCSLAKAAGAVGVGLLLGTVGLEVSSDVIRFTGGVESLAEGLYAEIVLICFVLIPRVLVLREPTVLNIRWLRNLCSEPLREKLGASWRKLLLVAACVIFPYDLLEIQFGALLGLLVGFSVVGTLFFRHGIPTVSLYLAFNSSAALEEHSRRALLLAQGDFGAFAQRPIVLSLLTVMVVMLLARWMTSRYLAVRPIAS